MMDDLMGDGEHFVTIRPDITEVVHKHRYTAIGVGDIAIGLSTGGDGETEFHFLLGPFSSVGYSAQEVRALVASIIRQVEEVERGK